MRRPERIALRACAVTIIVLCVFTVGVWAQYRRSPAVTPTTNAAAIAEDWRFADHERRLGILEALRVDARLSVMETIDQRSREVRMLAYSQFFALLANLGLAGAQIFMQRAKRLQPP